MSQNDQHFPDDQNPEKPFYAENTIDVMGQVTREKRMGRLLTKWAYLKVEFAPNEAEVRSFYKTAPDAKVVRQGDTWAVWTGTDKESEPVGEPFAEEEFVAARTIPQPPPAMPAPSKVETAPAPPSGLATPDTSDKPKPKPIRPNELNDIGITLYRIFESLFQTGEPAWTTGGHIGLRHCNRLKDLDGLAGELFTLSDKFHALAARIETDAMRETLKKKAGR
jgi:hypothetical protein